MLPISKPATWQCRVETSDVITKDEAADGTGGGMQRGRFGRVSGQVARQANTKQDVWGEAQQATATRCTGHQTPDSSQVPCTPMSRCPLPATRPSSPTGGAVRGLAALRPSALDLEMLRSQVAPDSSIETWKHAGIAQHVLSNVSSINPHIGPLPHELLSNRLAPHAMGNY